tara:strand:+ start:2291 stop:2827 length:537 start_codon:yes stop_codon:yes gene_type:complete
MSQVCKKCGENKPFSEFHKAKTGKNGLRSDCKVCKNKTNKVTSLNWYHENRDERVKYSREYKESHKCKHGREMRRCRECSEEPIGIIIQRMMDGSKGKDRMYERSINVENYIDKKFLKELIKNNLNCYYCNIEFNYIEKCQDYITLERLNNNLPHTKDNCTLACLKCNVSKLSNQTTD